MVKIITFLMLLIMFPSAKGMESSPYWVRYLRGRIPKLLKKEVGKYGIYIKSLKGGYDYSYNGSDKFYYASTVKMFVLLEVMFAVEAGKLNLSHYHKIRKKDFRDGSGLSRSLKIGSRISLKNLVKNMIMYSDNLATDILIEKVGIKNINRRVKELSNYRIGDITTLLRVRQEMYGYLHPKGRELTNYDYYKIRRRLNTIFRLNQFAKSIGKKSGTFKYKDWYSATEKYYQTGLNSGSVMSYALILEKLVTGSEIPKPVSENVFKYLYKTQTGKNRVRKYLPQNIKWAHKTGTQSRRACDMGIAGNDYEKEVIITICGQDFGKTSVAERNMAKVSQLLVESKIFENNKIIK